MATEAIPNRRSKFLRKLQEPRPEAEPEKKPKRRRWRLRLFIAGVLLLATFWLLPGIVAHTPLLNMIIDRATADLDGQLAVRSASLGWLSPIEASGVELCDSGGKAVLTTEKVASDKSLLAMLLEMPNLGKFSLQRPQLNVVLHDGGSNLEEILAEYLKPSDEPSSNVGFELEIVDGSVLVDDLENRRSWQIDKLRLAMSMSTDSGKPINLSLSADIAGQTGNGNIDAQLSLTQNSKDESPLGTGKLTLEANDLPLQMLDPLLARVMPNTHVAGRASSSINASWGAAEEKGGDKLSGNVSVAELSLTTPAMGTDRLQLADLKADCRLEMRGDRIQVRESKLDCDLGSISAAGAFSIASDMDLDGLLHQTFDLRGRIDLARLAAMLPETLHIRRETRIRSGEVTFAANSRPNDESPRVQPPKDEPMVWQARFEVANLTAIDRGRELSWEKPVLLTLAAYDSPRGPVIESLKCNSDFLNIHAAGTPDKLAASASFDLAKLAQQLGQFVELGGLRLAGNGWSHFNWERSGDNSFTTDAELQLRSFQLAVPEKRPWTEENLLLFFSAEGRTDLGADTQFDKASLLVKSDSEWIDAKITQPVLDLRQGGVWPLRLKMHGRLDRWLPRIEVWMPLDKWRLAGACDVDAEATVSVEQIALKQARMTIDNLQVQGPATNIVEPKAELLLAGLWDQPGRQLTVGPATLSTTTLALRVDNIVVAVPEDKPIEAAGSLSYRADVGRLQKWFTTKNKPPAWRLAGMLSGEAKVRHEAERIDVQVDATVDNLTVTGDAQQKFQEPKITLTASGSYLHQSAVIRLDQARLTSGALAGNVAGNIAMKEDRTDLQLAGEMDYDLEKLLAFLRQNASLRPYLDGKVMFVGTGTNPLEYRGPMSPATARASTGVGWQWANLYGFQVGPGRANATLSDGVLRLEPQDLAVSGGRMRLAARLRLDPEPLELTLPPGPLVSQVQINQKMCDSFMKYIAPVLADVASAKGSFSIDLDNCRIPLSDPAKGDLAGRLTVHSMEVGPGPLIRELSVLLGSVVPGKLRRESVVKFYMKNGRVHHQGLELIFPDLTIRTYGWVDVGNQAISIMAEMPVPPKWIGNNVIGSALRNQTIRLPIGGTLSKPQIDRRVLDQLSQQFIGNATRNILEDEGKKFLENLFGQPRQ